jgi:hypothetical protein
MLRFPKPPVGAKVEVITETPDIVIWSPYDVQRLIYTGDVLDDFKWMDDKEGTFTLRTADGWDHIMYLKTIIQMTVNGKKVKRQRVAVKKVLPDKTWQFPSVKMKNMVHYTTRKNGEYSCTCYGFKFHHKCCHIDKVRNLK